MLIISDKQAELKLKYFFFRSKAADMDYISTTQFPKYGFEVNNKTIIIRRGIWALFTPPTKVNL